MFVYSQPTQLPATDDISPDALEYLFSTDEPVAAPAPWVVMAGGQEAVMPSAAEIIRLQTKVDLLLESRQLSLQQLQAAHFESGYLKARLADAEQQLKLLAEYRARAAAAILGDQERASLKRRVAELEARLESYKQALAALKSPPLDSAALYAGQSQGRTLGQRRRIDLLPIICALMVCFAASVLATIFTLY